MTAHFDAATALIVVDVQNDFADPKGSLYVRGAEEILATVNSEVRLAAAAGALIVYTQDWHPPSTPHFARDGGAWPVHCVGGSWGSEFHPRLRVLPAPIVRKGTGGEDGYSGFTVRAPGGGDSRATELGALIAARDVHRIVISGLATDYCVKDTALDARTLGLDVTVLRKAVRAVEVTPGDGDRAFEAMAAAGVEVA